MIGTRFAAGLALVAGFALTPAAHAGDTYRLDLPQSATTSTLDLRGIDSDDDLIATRYYRGGFHGGFSGGYHGHGYGGYRGAGFVGYRGYGYGGYRGAGFVGYRGYGYGGYRGYYAPYYGGFAYSGFYRPYYAPRVFYGASYYVPPTYSFGYWPCSDTEVVPSMPPAISLGITPTPSLQGRIVPAPEAYNPPQVTNPLPVLPEPAAQPGTFPYDGGPKAPVPMPPATDPAPAKRPAGDIRPSDERFVSFPTPTISAQTAGVTAKGTWAYPTYGEVPTRARPAKTSFAEERIVPGR